MNNDEPKGDRILITPTPKCVAFDCFGTLFDMSTVPKDEIAAYVEHVRRNDFSPYEFPRHGGIFHHIQMFVKVCGDLGRRASFAWH